jgi:hypothetical protein
VLRNPESNLRRGFTGTLRSSASSNSGRCIFRRNSRSSVTPSRCHSGAPHVKRSPAFQPVIRALFARCTRS